MKMKKTWFSYLAWFLFSAYTGIMFAVYLSTLGAGIWHLNKYETALLICGVFALCGGLWFAGRWLYEYVAKWISGDDYLLRMLEYFLVMCVVAGAILYRIYLLFHYDGAVEGHIYYEMATVKSLAGIPEITHGASYIYTAVLSFVFSFAGNKVMAGVFLQLILQIAAMVMFYFAVKLLAGRTEAFCVAVIMAFLPAVGGQIFFLSPEPLFFLLYATGLWLIGLCAGKRASSGLYVVIGLYAGILTYLDIMGAALLFFAVLVSLKKGVGKREIAIRDMIWEIIIFIPAMAIGMAACFFADALLSGRSAISIINTWLGSYTWAGIGDIQIPQGSGLLWYVLLYMCAAFGVVGFWFHKEQKQDGWVLLLAAVTFLNVTNVGQMKYEILFLAVLSVFVGIGITSIGIDIPKADKNPLQEIVVEEIVDEEIPEKDISKEDISKEDIFKEDISKEGIQREDIIREDISGEEIQEEQNPEKPVVKFIENPLPLPKKHVKKEMDYDRDFTETKLDFDVQVNEEDDFDIQ